MYSHCLPFAEVANFQQSQVLGKSISKFAKGGEQKVAISSVIKVQRLPFKRNVRFTLQPLLGDSS